MVKFKGKTFTFNSLVKEAYLNRVSLSSSGFYATPKIHFDRKNFKGRPFLYFAYGAAVSEVIIDVLTGENKIIQADCLDVMIKMPANSIDMVLCDLPYGTTQNKWDSVIDLESLWKQYNRIVKKDGAIVLTSQGIFTAKLILSNEKDFKYKIIWIK